MMNKELKARVQDGTLAIRAGLSKARLTYTSVNGNNYTKERAKQDNLVKWLNSGVIGDAAYYYIKDGKTYATQITPKMDIIDVSSLGDSDIPPTIKVFKDPNQEEIDKWSEYVELNNYDGSEKNLVSKLSIGDAKNLIIRICYAQNDKGARALAEAQLIMNASTLF